MNLHCGPTNRKHCMPHEKIWTTYTEQLNKRQAKLTTPEASSSKAPGVDSPLETSFSEPAFSHAKTSSLSTGLVPNAFSTVKFADNNGGNPKYLHNAKSVIIQFRGNNQIGLARAQVVLCQDQITDVRAAWYLVKHHKSLNIEANSRVYKIDSTQNLRGRNLVKTMKHNAELAGEDPSKYGSHSLRSGGAAALFNAEFDSLEVKLFGQWSSDAAERYTRICEALTMQMSRAMINPVSQ
ncbi:LOW QUALITY PROTEIN: hypothetical protein PHMEG_00024859 [Phytophthora megakarya]|uniref:Tyr recombinase domain-containing protein n=1 Tax=Phytophthora megakarya TaxID=4795 RepID=A0A225VEW4_9STRA|nr:LOW QUALITY PROTEIN: hypothetical protein PHMEG_00024859 [Phytophthora megakarya]